MVGGTYSSVRYRSLICVRVIWTIHHFNPHVQLFHLRITTFHFYLHRLYVTVICDCTSTYLIFPAIYTNLNYNFLTILKRMTRKNTVSHFFTFDIRYKTWQTLTSVIRSWLKIRNGVVKVFIY